MGELTTILDDLLGDPHFLYSLATGVVMLGVLFAARRLGAGRFRGWAMSYAAAALVILVSTFSVDPSLWLRLLLVAATGAVVNVVDSMRRWRWMSVMQATTWALLGLSVLFFTTEVTAGSENWLLVVLPVWVIALGLGMRWLDRSPLADVSGPLLAITIVGVWVTVPETDMVEVILGLSPALALVTLPPVRSRVTTSGCFAIACLLGWLVVDGGSGMAIPIVGGLAAVGILGLAPLAGTRRFHRGGLPVLAVHLIFVVIATRVVDWLESMTTILLALSLLNVATLVALLALPSPADSEREALTVEA